MAEKGVVNGINVDGWFGAISKFLLWILGILYGFVGNYGVAIIMLTMAVRLALLPISKKGQVSMFRMQGLQPKVVALRERFTDPMRAATSFKR